MNIERNLELVDTVLDSLKATIGADFDAYKNHVYRVIHLCFSLHPCSATDREKIQIAACFHDVGIWTQGTLDYLDPSEHKAVEYLKENGLDEWIPEVSEMITMHHGVRSRAQSSYELVDCFRRADIADFSLGLCPMGVSRPLIKQLKAEFPNQGFHKRLLVLGVGWFFRHPLNPLPMFRW